MLELCFLFSGSYRSSVSACNHIWAIISFRTLMLATGLFFSDCFFQVRCNLTKIYMWILANHNAQALQTDSQKEGEYSLKIIPLPWLKSSKAIILVSNDYFISQHAFCPTGDSTGINCDDASWLHQLPQKEEATGKALVLIPALLARGSDSIWKVETFMHYPSTIWLLDLLLT